MHLDQRTDHLVRPIPKSSELSPFLCHPRVVGPHSETVAAFFAESEGIFLDSAHDLGRYDQRKGRSVCRYHATYASILAARSSVLLLEPLRCPRERGRPSRARGVRQSLARCRAVEALAPVVHRAHVHPEEPGDVRRRHSVRHHQHGLRPTNQPLLRPGGSQRLLDPRALFSPQRERNRRTTTVRSTRERAVVDHVTPLHRRHAHGKETSETSAARH